MIVFPAIDLKGGDVVRLAEGDMNRATVYADDPAAQAMLFAEQGAQFLHVVDLDGAFAGRPENAEAVEGIIENFPGYIQLGGGIRNGGRAAGHWHRCSERPDICEGYGARIYRRHCGRR